MIDKDQVPVLKAMIRTTYAPVIRRALANLLLLDIQRMIGNLKAEKHFSDAQCMETIYSSAGKMALQKCIRAMESKKENMTNEILLQYGLTLSADEQEFYHYEFGRYFMYNLDYISSLVAEGKFKKLYNLTTNPLADTPSIRTH